MSCAEIRPLLYDHAAGELAAAWEARVGEHLARCPECREAAAAAADLQRAVARLPRERLPGRDLWPAIAERIGGAAETAASGRFAAGWWRAAAALVLVAGGLIAAAVLRPGPGERRLSESPPAQIEVRPAAAVELRRRDGVEHAYRDLLAAVEQRRSGLDPQAAAALDDGLADLERALAEIQSALASSPENRRLQLALARAYRREASWAGRLSDG